MAGQWGTGNYSTGYAGQSVNNGVCTVFINNENSVYAYPVAAGNMVTLVDLDHGKMWFKSTEANGMPCLLRTFEIKEVTPQATQSGDMVTRKEFEALSVQIQQLMNSLKQNAGNIQPMAGGEESK